MKTLLLSPRTRNPKTPTSAMEDSTQSYYFPGCRKDANCSCQMCIDSFNATLDLMSMSVQKSSLSKFSSSKLRVEKTPISIDPTLRTPEPKPKLNRISTPPTLLRSTVKTGCSRTNVTEKKKIGLGLRCLKWVLVVGAILGLELGFSFGILQVLKPRLKVEIVRGIVEKSLVVKSLSERLMLIQQGLGGFVDGKVSRCNLGGSTWTINQAPPKDVPLEGRVSISRVNINPGEHCSAVIQTGGKKYYGAEGFLSINKPQVYMPGQWSSSRIKLSNGAESVEAGWMVNPDVFKDNETHLYAKFAGAKSGCINTDCPGFVHVGEKVNLGRLPEHYGQQYYWNISIDKHQDDDNWWLSISPSKYQIGYWPKNLFTSLADAASQIEWGGEINNPGPSNPPPDMGNGREVNYDSKLSAFIGHLTLIDESFNAINPRDTVTYQDCESLYKVLDFGYKGETFGHFIVFGGGNPTDT